MPNNNTSAVRVSVRVRPQSSYSESLHRLNGRGSIVQAHKGARAITVGASESSNSGVGSVQGNKHQFTYDEVYDERASQTDIYKGVGLGMLKSVFDGYNATVRTWWGWGRRRR